jgi:hypothetical protein
LTFISLYLDNLACPSPGSKIKAAKNGIEIHPTSQPTSPVQNKTFETDTTSPTTSCHPYNPPKIHLSFCFTTAYHQDARKMGYVANFNAQEYR